MRRRIAVLALPAAAIITAALAAPSGAASDRTGPTGPFGITTVGLGAGAQYGEPSLAMAPDGTHYAVSTPGDNDQKKGTVQVWHSADRQCFEFILSRDSGDVRPELGFHVCGDDRARRT